MMKVYINLRLGELNVIIDDLKEFFSNTLINSSFKHDTRNQEIYIKTLEDNENLLYKTKDDISVSEDWNISKEEKLIDRLLRPKKIQYKRINHIKDLRECTYHPQINKRLIIKEVEPPRAYYEAVNRLKKVRTEKQLKKQTEENNYLEIDKKFQRSKHKPMNPPSFLDNSYKLPKRQVLFYVDINIRPGKYLHIKT